MLSIFKSKLNTLQFFSIEITNQMIWKLIQNHIYITLIIEHNKQARRFRRSLGTLSRDMIKNFRIKLNKNIQQNSSVSKHRTTIFWKTNNMC